MKKLIYTLVYSIVLQLIERIDSLEVNCDEKEPCYYIDNVMTERVNKVTGDKMLLNEKFGAGIKLKLVKPPEFQNNTDNNPFPLLHMDMYVANRIDGRESKYLQVFVKLKNRNKKTRETVHNKGSMLEGDDWYEFPDLIIVFFKPENVAYKTEAKEEYEQHGKLINRLDDDFSYSMFEFPMNQYMNLLKNPIQIDIRRDEDRTSRYNLHGRESPSYVNEQAFLNNLSPYFDMCQEIRMDDGMNGEDFRQLEIKNMAEGERKGAERMHLIDFLRYSNNIYKIGSICSAIDKRISGDLNCFREKNCESFLKIEKRKSNLYQFNFFIKKSVQYARITFSHQSNPRVKYEITCFRYSAKSEHVLINYSKYTKISELELLEAQSTDHLILSTNGLLYCGVILPINRTITLAGQRLKYDLDDDTNLQLELGVLTGAKNETYSTWTSFVLLDLSFQELYFGYKKTSLIVIAIILVLVICACLIVSFVIVRKYQKLSQKLTEVGSSISNTEIASGMKSSLTNENSKRKSSIPPNKSLTNTSSTDKMKGKLTKQRKSSLKKHTS